MQRRREVFTRSRTPVVAAVTHATMVLRLSRAEAKPAELEEPGLAINPIAMLTAGVD